MTSAPILAGVIGYPIEHSLSPLIHTHWAAQHNIQGYYIPIPVPPDYKTFAKTIDSLRVIGFAGVNVTLPHKEHALRYADSKTQNAAAAGAANMLTFKHDGVVADNSDIHGFAQSIAGRFDATPRKAVVLGAGGAARAIVLAIKSLGCNEILIANRTQEKAEHLAQDFDVQTVHWAERSGAIEGADIVVNTTSLGMSGQPALNIDLSAAPQGAVIADIVYSPLETPLLRAAKDLGMGAVGGLSMLMHQAAPGFSNWFGADPVVDATLEELLIRELQKRGAA